MSRPIPIRGAPPTREPARGTSAAPFAPALNSLPAPADLLPDFSLPESDSASYSLVRAAAAAARAPSCAHPIPPPFLCRARLTRASAQLRGAGRGRVL